MTILSYDNSGEIKFEADIEMEQGYWNTSSSRLWTKVRDLFHDELVEVYKDMRANGVTYENIMHYMYDEQIAKIPQIYFNMDYDIKYAPYSDQYLGKAHGDGLQHMKRWLKRRFLFCDTLYDYAPSYNNDVLTIRANTTEEMTLEIETYSPVYQHVSWYNGQMDKKKIDGKTSVTFNGFSQTATDQEVLIYGGSNIKSIKGVSSMNPNSMLIGGATRLTELDISNCPILTIVNSNKANFSPHTYLNKLNISNCPQLGGNLNVSNSPLLQEINARNSAITGLLLPTSLRNLKTLELPNTISSLALYDAGVLENLKFDEGVAMQSIELSNCPGITNTENFDLTQTPTVILDNSYDTEELYMSATTNLTLRNMKNMERVIYTPNSEYETFNINNVIGGKNYKVTTSSCPKLKTFMTTAPFRYSYSGKYKQFIEASEKVYTVSDMTENNSINWQTGANYDADVFCRLPYTEVCVGDTIKIESTHRYQIDPSCWVILYDNNKTYKGAFSYNRGNGEYNTTNGEVVVLNDGYMRIRMHDSDTDGKVYYTRQSKTIMTEDITPNTVFTANTLDLSATQFTDIKLLCTTDLYNLKVPTTMKNFYCDSAFDIDTDVIEDASYEVIHEELIEPYTTNYEGEVVRISTEPISTATTDICTTNGSISANNDFFGGGKGYVGLDYIRVVPGTPVGANFWVFMLMQYDTNQKMLSQTRVYDNGNTTLLSDNCEYIRFQLEDSTYLVEGMKFTYTPRAEYTPNIMPSSANGSLIFNMYSNNTTQPTSTSPYMWDLTGLKLNDFYTYGMNNWVKQDENNNISMPQRIPGYSVRLVNADITPDEYPTMLYPKWIDTGLPITGKLDYTKYNGTSLAWAYAYTTNDVSINPLGSREQVNITNDYNKLYGTDFIDIVDVWIYKDTDTTNLSVNENITKAYIELTAENTAGDGASPRIKSVLQWYPNCDTLYFFDDGTIPVMVNLLYGTNPYRSQIKKVVFMDGYFEGVTNIQGMFNDVFNLESVENLPKNATYMRNTFRNCKKITQVPNIPQGVTDLQECFNGCTSLTTAPTIPSSITNMRDCFVNCTSLTKTPILPNNIANFVGCFNGCTALTTVTNIPSNCTNMASAFRECPNLISVPRTGYKGDLDNIFNGCTSLNQEIVIESSYDLSYAFCNCSSLTIPPILPSDYQGSMIGCFRGCTSLTTAPTIPSSVTNMGSCFYKCTSLTQAPNIPNGVTDISMMLALCEKVTSITLPLANIQTYNGALNSTGITDITWVGERNSDFDITSLYFNGCSQEDIKELVPGHLADLTTLGTTATLTLGSTYLTYLTEEEIAQATAKGWILE